MNTKNFQNKYVRIHNDDVHTYGHMESIASYVFGKSADSAHECAVTIDTVGWCDFGPFIPEIAHTKLDAIQQINLLNSISINATVE